MSDVNVTATPAPVDNVTTEPAASTPAPVVPNKKKFNLKVDGHEEEMELDLNDEKEIIRHLQMSKAASKRMNEAAVTKRQATQFLEALRDNPMSVLSDERIMGNKKFQEIAEQFLSKKLQEEMMSPEERVRAEMEQKLRRYEEQEKTQREEQENKQRSALEQHYTQEYEKTIMTALQHESLPKNPYTVKRMASLMQKNLQHGLELSPEHLASLVKEDYKRELVSLIGSSDAEQILSIFGEDVSNKIRKRDLEKFKAGQFQQKQDKPAATAPQESPPKRMRAHEYDEWLKKKNGL